MVNPLVVNIYNQTVEIWDDKQQRYVTLSWPALKATHDVMVSQTPVPGVVYKTEPTPPELCKHGIDIDDLCDECAVEAGMSRCEQCDEIAWDGRICHACGMKEI
jgi:hypothetical protein